MVCESCGEKPKNTAKDFTKAVIEINNPETLVLLRKVVIPASMGTEEDVPVAIGKYRNVLLQYEANNHIYLYSSDGIPTAITANIPQEVLDSIDELEDDVVDLQNQIDDLKNSPDVVDIVDTYADLQAYDTSHLGDKDIIRVLTDETHDGASSYYRWNKQTETWTYVGSIQTAANTIFYADLSETGNTRHIYKNSDMTGAVSVQELLDANEDGQVILRMSSAQTPENFNDAYLQNTYVGVDDYQFLFLDNRNYYEYDGTATTDTSYYYSKSTIQLELTAGNNITITGNTISATDTTYSNFTGTDGTSAGAAGLVPAPATTDAGKFLKADGTWDTAGGGGGDTVYSDKTTSSGNTGGAVYIGNLNSSQEEQPDPTTTDNHWKYFWVLPSYNNKIPNSGSINILGNSNGSSSKSDYVVIGTDATAYDTQAIAIGRNAKADGQAVAIGVSAQAGNWTGKYGMVAIGSNTSAYEADYSINIGGNSNNSHGVKNASSTASIAIGKHSQVGTNAAGLKNSIALGSYAQATRQGELNIGLVTGETTGGYNDTAYRVIGGVHDAVDTHDAVTLGQLTAYSVVSGAGAPTTSTAAQYIGQFYYDTTNDDYYYCTAITAQGTTPETYSYF